MPSYVAGVFLAVSTYKGPQLVYHYFDSSFIPVHDDNDPCSDDEDEVEFSDEDSTPPPTPLHSESTSHALGIPDTSSQANVSLPGGFDSSLIAETLTPPQSLCNCRFSLTIGDYAYVGIPVHILDSGTWRIVKESATKADGIVTENDSPMRMFHVSFVLRAPINEAASAENDVYKWILVPLVRFLRNEQASSNYVWKEVKNMRRACENLETMEQKQEAMEQNSELARTLRTLCVAVICSGIARVSVNGHQRAFQIPQLQELVELPNWVQTPVLGAYVSTSNLSGKEIQQTSHECYGLLLLNDPESIVKELSVDPRSAAAVLIRSIDPTLSISQLANTTNIELKQIVSLMWSLVYWRRARVIIPLNIRQTYVLSPLAPLDNVHQLAKEYYQCFPMMPPLQKQLALLSGGRHKPFISQIPSLDHRHIYLRSLEWMMQHNLVVHLATFAMVVATRKIKLAVADSELESGKQGDRNGPDNTAAVSRAISTLALPDASSGESELHDKTVPANSPPKVHRLRRTSPYKFDSASEVQDTVIRDPRIASNAEKKWIRQISVSGASKSKRLSQLFDRLIVYMNGKDCLEQVMLKENLTVEEMRAFMAEFTHYVVTFKHW